MRKCPRSDDERCFIKSVGFSAIVLNSAYNKILRNHELFYENVIYSRIVKSW